MNDLDKKIREALRAEDAEIFAELTEEPSMYEMAMETFRGRNRWMMVLCAVFTLVCIVLGVLAAIRFFEAQTTRDMMMWGGACLICMGAFAMMKIWGWMEISKNFVTREIKRVELQIARLASRIKD